MSLLRSHVVLMLFYSVMTGAFFALLWKNDRRERIRLFLIISLSLFVGGVLLAWIMFPFPAN